MALFNHFEDWFEKHVKSRPELALEFPEPGSAPEPFPVADCLAILRATSVLLENTMNKHLYQSYDVRGSIGVEARGRGRREVGGHA